MTLTEFIEARLAGKERGASGCMNCGEPIRPHTPSKTGYTHGDRSAVGGGWQGIRCAGKLTGAQPWPDPARVLREVEAMQKILELWEDPELVRNPYLRDDLAENFHDGRDPDEIREQAETAELIDSIARTLAAIWSDHPDYDPAWQPGV